MIRTNGISKHIVMLPAVIAALIIVAAVTGTGMAYADVSVQYLDADGNRQTAENCISTSDWPKDENYPVLVGSGEEGNMTRAAERLHVSQSTMSKQLKELENELGSKLFVRSNYSIKLTEAGILLKKRAEDILALVEKTEAEFRSAVVIDKLIDTGESSDLTFRPLTDVPGTGLYVIWRKYQTFTPVSQLLIDELEKRFRSNNTSEKSRS